MATGYELSNCNPRESLELLICRNYDIKRLDTTVSFIGVKEGRGSKL